MVQRQAIPIASAALALTLALAISGCRSAEETSATMTPKSQAATANVAIDGSMSEAPMELAGRSTPRRAVVRQARLSVEVENLEKSEAAMKASVREHGGYIADEDSDNLASEEPSLHLRIRIPEPSFEQVLTGFEALGRRTQKSIAASDITEDVLDAEAQIKSLEQRRRDSQSADWLKSEIQAAQNRRSELAVRASMSTIDLTLQQKANVHFSAAANTSWGADTWNAATASSMGAFRLLGAALIWLLVYSPIWGLAAMIGLGAARLLRRAFERRAQPV